MQIGQNNQAIKILKHILRINPDDETSMMEIGLLFMSSVNSKKLLFILKIQLIKSIQSFSLV